MEKTKSIIRADIVVPLLAVLAVLLAAGAILQPWWSMRTSPELQMMTNSTMSIDAGLFKRLNAARTDPNGTTSMLSFAITNDTAYQSPIFETITVNRTDEGLRSSFTFNISDLRDYQQQTKDLANTTGLTLILAGTGLVLAIVTMLLIIVVTRTKMTLERYTYAVGVLAVIFLLIAPLQLATGVTNFWGSLSIPASSQIWGGEALATWGPALGWYFMFAAALLVIVCLLPIRSMYSERMRGIQSLK